MKTALRALLLVFLSLGLINCGSSSDSNAFVRVIHGSPDAPNVDVLLDGVVVLSDVPYNIASDFLRIDSGDRRIEVRATGTDLVVIDATLNFPESSSSTIIASGLLANIGPIVLDDNRVPPAADTTRVRVTHNAASAPVVDVYVTAPGADLATATPVDQPTIVSPL